MNLLFQSGIKTDINLTEIEEILYFIFEEFNFDKYLRSIYTAKIIDSFLNLSGDKFGELLFFVNDKKIKIIIEKSGKKEIIFFDHNRKISYFFITYLKDAIKIRKKYTLLVDSLTSLPNRRYFFKFLENSIRESKIKHSKFAILFLDIKGFKFINDFYGNEIGDYVLQTIANRIKKISFSDSFIARIGADQFVILIKNFKNKEEIKYYINHFITILESPIKFEGYFIEVNLLVGVSIFPNDGNTKDELLQAADLALYELKTQESGNVLFFSQELKLNFLEAKILEKDLSNALKNNELFLVYQPKIDSQNNKIVGVEALLRWKHHKFGLIPNSKWIPILENSKSLKEIGIWVLQKALEDIYKLNKEFNLNLKVSINVDIKELTNDYYQKEIMKLSLNKRKILILELLERKAIKYWDELFKIREYFKKLSIKFSFDDFGTGNTTLKYLTKLLPDEIKIDRSFVMNIHISNNKIITKAIIAMAKSLDIKVVAEGVETEDELKVLNELGCFVIQGFLFAKPMLLENLKSFIKDKK